MPKKIVGAKSDKTGKTVSVLLEGNKNSTPVKTAIRMIDAGQISGAHVVRPANSDPYIRSNPNKSTGDNIDNLSGDK
jgi:hypothetical protein